MMTRAADRTPASSRVSDAERPCRLPWAALLGSLSGASLLLASSPLFPQVPAAIGELKTAEAARTDDPITIDGLLDEEAWNGATVITDLHQILPVEFSEPSQRTEFLVLYDDDALYLAARMYDDQPDRVVAKVLRQGGMSWLDDQFNIILDPFNDKRSGYRFQVNPNGVWEEGLFRGGDQMQWEWSGIWQASASRNDEGWVAETRIPFKTVSFNPDN
ncbi:MAG: carbohydrate binding family 9 domain-containing protein, partial [Proteobacteria bacterium]|nr:carbohydrate binding family 9 domain-containing protein [Pseudomonadota bacterium]